ncbi:3861_t:CDS:2 [Diversispora eburnea]|uniref:3861_t:CDS:1 n=1 Tax=Diversispora eburnea TaxID=1213867 RepID=A0A9N9FPW2_9GLOM|nr:3861_t:CDS:2 [Diversispora eburnea]
MSFSWLTRIAENRLIKKFDYNTFEDFTIIASGAFGVVSRAYSKDFEQKAALKCMHDENSNDFIKQFNREMQLSVAIC